MNALSLVAFYGFLALAVALWRGDLTPWARGADAWLSLAAALLGVAILLLGWRRKKAVVPGRSGRRRAWWVAAGGAAAAAAVLSWLFLQPLPWLARAIARPASQDTAESTPGNNAVQQPVEPGPLPAPAPQPPSDAPQKPDASIVSPAGAIEPPFDWKFWLLVVAGVITGVLAAWLLWPRKRASSPAGEPRRSWWDDPHAPAYVRDLRLLCAQWEVFPQPGDTLRTLLQRLSDSGHDARPLHAMADYHYHVWFGEGVPDPAAEKRWRTAIRTLRQSGRAATAHPPAGTAPAA